MGSRGGREVAGEEGREGGRRGGREGAGEGVRKDMLGREDKLKLATWNRERFWQRNLRESEETIDMNRARSSIVKLEMHEKVKEEVGSI